MFEGILYLGIAVIFIFFVFWWVFRTSDRSHKKRKKKEGVKPTAYDTMPQYFPTEQVDIVQKIRSKKRKKKK